MGPLAALADPGDVWAELLTGKMGLLAGSVTRNGPTAWVGRWLPLLHICRLSTGLASPPADTHRNTHALITVFCTPQPGWVQLHFGKCSGCIIPWLTQSQGTQSSPCTRKSLSSKELPMAPALPKHPLSSSCCSSCFFQGIFTSIITALVQQERDLLETRAAECGESPTFQ